MRFLLTIMIMVSTSLTMASTIVSTQIHDIDMGLADETPLIFLTTGQVVTYPTANKSTFDLLKNAIQNKTWYSLTINAKREITDLEEISAPVLNYPRLKISPHTTPFNPSILKDLDQARGFFYEARTDALEESQCFDRAHIWAYEWRINKNLYSSKAWLFFTRRFIRKYKFEWWFHVAPMVHVIVDGAVKERVMDIKYALGPLSLKQWTDVFMRNKADCPVVAKYTDHANYTESGSCFLMKSSMYYYQPVDLEKEEMTGEKRHKWHVPEVKHAYLEGFEVDLGASHE